MIDDLDLSRALTVTQPWGGLLATGIKPIENRKQKIAPRGLFGKRFAIHASREIDEDVYARIMQIDDGAFRATCLDYSDGMIRQTILTDSPWYQLSRITSAIIGVVTLEPEVLIGQGNAGDQLTNADRELVEQKCGRYATRWFFGRIGYVLSHATILPTPVPCRGHQGFWTMKPDIRAAVHDQLAARAA